MTLKAQAAVKKGESLKFSGFFPHFFIEHFHAGDEVKNKHLTFSYKLFSENGIQ